MARITGWIVACGLIVLLASLLGCTKEVVREVEVVRDVEVVVTATPGPGSGQPAAPVQPPAAGRPTAPAQPAATAQAPQPTATSSDDGRDEEQVYQLGISADLTTTNYWAYLGPDGTIWNQYVLGGGKARAVHLLRPAV